MEPHHVEKIHNWLRAFEDVLNYVKVATIKELHENDCNLNIPLYVEKIIEGNLPSVDEAMGDLKNAWQSSLEAEERFKTVLQKFL